MANVHPVASHEASSQLVCMNVGCTANLLVLYYISVLAKPVTICDELQIWTTCESQTWMTCEELRESQFAGITDFDNL